MRQLAGVRALGVALAAGLVLALSTFAGAAGAEGFDLLVRIAPDAAVVPVNSSNGYTLSLTNTADRDIDVQEVLFLLPGHGVPQVEEESFGEPRQSRDVTPAFTYVKGSTTGMTTDDPIQVDRWLSWSGGTVAAGSTSTLHFQVKVSSAPLHAERAARAVQEGRRRASYDALRALRRQGRSDWHTDN